MRHPVHVHDPACTIARLRGLDRVRKTPYATMISEGLALVASQMVISDLLNYLVGATVFGKVKTSN